MPVSVPFNLQNGQPNDATQVDANFAALVTGINAIPQTPGQYPGTTTNDNAPAGDVGELIKSTLTNASAIGLTSNVAANVTSISLTPGDWDVSGIVWFTGAVNTTVTYTLAGIGTVSATPPPTTTGDTNVNAICFGNAAIYLPAFTAVTVGPIRISLNVTTTVYLTASSVFAVSTSSVWGTIRARRMR